LFAERVSLPDGSVYEGPIIDGKFNGQGKLFSDGKFFYEGNFKDGLMDGYGVIHSDTYEYTGKFKEGEDFR
jgi:hypothetical protein